MKQLHAKIRRMARDGHAELSPEKIKDLFKLHNLNESRHVRSLLKKRVTHERIAHNALLWDLAGFFAKPGYSERHPKIVAEIVIRALEKDNARMKKLSKKKVKKGKTK